MLLAALGHVARGGVPVGQVVPSQGIPEGFAERLFDRFLKMIREPGEFTGKFVLGHVFTFQAMGPVFGSYPSTPETGSVCRRRASHFSRVAYAETTVRPLVNFPPPASN